MKWIKIIGMSYKLKDLKDDLRHQGSFEFAQHCAKLIVCNYDDYNITLWKKQLYSFCSWIMQAQLKPNNKKPSRELIWEYFFCSYCDSKDTFSIALRDAWDILELNYKGKRNTSKDQEIFNFYREFCKQICNNLYNCTLNINNISELADKYLTNLYRKLVKE